MEPKYKPLPVGFRFRPTDYEIANYFLKKKVLGQLMKARTVPEECHDIFSKHPRDLPGYPKEEHWYYYSRKRNSQVTSNSCNLWTPYKEESNVLDPKNIAALVGIKRRFTLIKKEEEEEDDEYNWFMDEISLPQTIADTDWVLCHIFGKKIKPEFVCLPTIESESER